MFEKMMNAQMNMFYIGLSYWLEIVTGNRK
jgi:hypothetical protein